MTFKNRKGQEEIVGFVLIVVVVSVVLLIFLGLTLTGDSEIRRESRDVSQFLDSAMEVTSDCAVNFVPDYSRLGELFEECYSGSRCVDGREACEVLEADFEGIIGASWQIGEEFPVKGYNFSSFYTTNLTEEEIISFSDGNCNGSISGADYLTPAFPGRIVGRLELCY